MVTQDEVDFIYRQYKINCVTRPTLYNTNYDQKCPKFTSLLQTMLTNGQKPSDLTDDAYNSLLTTLGVKVDMSMTDLGNKYKMYKCIVNQLCLSMRMPIELSVTQIGYI
jgi:hypothetical protein